MARREVKTSWLSRYLQVLTAYKKASSFNFFYLIIVAGSADEKKIW